MSPFKAKCRDCESELFGEDKQEIGKIMIEHHNTARLQGSWTSAACGLFFTKETDNEDKVINERWLEATMNTVVTPWVGEVWFDPRKERR